MYKNVGVYCYTDMLCDIQSFTVMYMDWKFVWIKVCWDPLNWIKTMVPLVSVAPS